MSKNEEKKLLERVTKRTFNGEQNIAFSDETERVEKSSIQRLNLRLKPKSRLKKSQTAEETAEEIELSPKHESSMENVQTNLVIVSSTNESVNPDIISEEKDSNDEIKQENRGKNNTETFDNKEKGIKKKLSKLKLRSKFTKEKSNVSGDANDGESINRDIISDEKDLNNEITKENDGKNITEISNNKDKGIKKKLSKLKLRSKFVKEKRNDDDDDVHDAHDVHDVHEESKSSIKTKITESVGSDSTLLITVHRCENIKSDRTVLHPLVQIHIIDSESGKYILKKIIDRNKTSDYGNKLMDYVMPIMTKPCYLNKGGECYVWEDAVTYNEEYDYFIKSGIIFFFEILDFETPLNNDHRNVNNWWYRIGWAFLRPVSVTEEYIHTGHRVGLQLYKPFSHQLNNTTHLSTEIYEWWKNRKKVAIPGILFITIEPLLRKSNNTNHEYDSIMENNDKTSLKEIHSLKSDNTPHNENDSSNETFLLWSRLEGQTCKLPKTRMHTLPAGGRGCFSVKFSNDGRKIACAAPISVSNLYSIYIYEIPSAKLLNHLDYHNGIVYDIDWSHDDGSILSVSNDCTARVWTLNTNYDCIKTDIIAHPCYLYCGKFCSSKSNIVTGGFDGIIRFWNLSESASQEPQLIQEFNAHNGPILCFCLNYRNIDNIQLFSGGSDGTINIFDYIDSKWTIQKCIEHKDLKDIPINSISLHPNASKLLLFCRDSVHRLIDYKLEIIVQHYKGSMNFSHFIRGCQSPCGQLAFIGSEDGTLLVWKTDTGPVSCVEYHPFDHILAFSGLGSASSVHLYRYTYNKTLLNPINKNTDHDIETPYSRSKLQYSINMLDSLMSHEN